MVNLLRYVSNKWNKLLRPQYLRVQKKKIVRQKGNKVVSKRKQTPVKSIFKIIKDN